jgi:outer membrane murein-binding lipoprotein Lpp
MGTHRNGTTILRRAWLAAALCGAVVLSGCVTDAPRVEPVDIGPLSSQIGDLARANADLRAANERLAQANAALQAENERLKAQLRADADAGLAANAKGWLPFEVYVFRQQIARLPGIQPDATTTAKWTEAAGLYAAGGEAAMRYVIDDLHDDATAQAKKLGELSSRIEQLTRERDAATEDATRALRAVEDAKAALAAAIQQARQDEAARIARETREWQIYAANWAGGGLFVATLGLAAAAWFLSAASKKLGEGAIVAFALCVGCFAFARFLGNPWFLPVSGTLYGIGFAGWMAWKIKAGINEREAKVKASRDGLVAAVLVQKLNDFYDASSAEMKAQLDAGLFAELEKAGPAYAEAVKRIKADIIAAAATLSCAPQASTQSPNCGAPSPSTSQP